MKGRGLFLATSIALAGCNGAATSQNEARMIDPELLGANPESAETFTNHFGVNENTSLAPEMARIQNETNRNAKDTINNARYPDKAAYYEEGKSVESDTTILHAAVGSKIPPAILSLSMLKILNLQSSAQQITNFNQLERLKNLEALTLDLPGIFNFGAFEQKIPILPKLQVVELVIHLNSSGKAAKAEEAQLKPVLDNVKISFERKAAPACKVKITYVPKR